MPDLNERLQVADQIEAPDLWSRIESEANSAQVLAQEPQPFGTVGRRLVAGVTAFAIFAVIAGLSWRSLRSEPAAVPDAHLTTYTDKLGWSIDYPSNWFVHPFAIGSRSGAAISNLPFTNKDRDAIGLPGITSFGHGVAIVISEAKGAPPHPRDSSFPLSTGNAKVIPGPTLLSKVLTFQGDGLGYTAVFGGGKDASKADADAVTAAIASFRVPRIAQDKTLNGWTSLGPARVFPQGRGKAWFLKRLRVIYVMRSTSGFNYVLDLKPDGCGEGTNDTWDPTRLQIWLQCVGRDVRYSVDGAPIAHNPSGFHRRLAAFPAAVSWDGQLLTAPGTRITVPPGIWTP